jgi:SNF2 family DNA or RNA helicase
MICKVCTTEQEQVDYSKFLSIVTLACKHSFSLTDEDKATEKEKIIFKDGREPFPYQYKGIKFVENANFRAIIADDMGVGKTIQFIGTIFRNPEVMCPCLILVKSSLKQQFFVELFNCLGPKFLPQVIDNAQTPPVQGIFKIHIATYDIIRRFTKVTTVKEKNQWGHEHDVEHYENPFYTFPFKSIVMDECQAIKSDSSARTKEVRRVCNEEPVIPCRIGMSGTPIKNSADEYGPILNLIRPDLFPSIERFNREWITDDWETGKWGKLRDPHRFHELTKGFIIRRSRQEVMPDLPKINRGFHHVDFENLKLKKQYQDLEDDIVNELEKKHANTESESIIGQISKARHLVGVIKINSMVEELQDFTENTDRKTALFLHHKDVMDAVKLKYGIWALENGYPAPLVFHSGLSSSDRFDLVKEFKESKARVMIASTLAAGEGVDGLQHVCSDIILGERQWNPANEEQVEARIERYGQEAGQLNAKYMILSNTIDEYFTKIVEKKRAEMKATMDGKQIDWKESGLMKELFTVMSAQRRKTVTKGW